MLYFRDTKWDGWQAKPRGSYKIKDINDKLVAQNYDLRDKGDIVSVHVTDKVSSTTAVEAAAAWQEVLLYPNPAAEAVCLSGRTAATGVGRWTLTDMQGRVLTGGVLSLEAGQAFGMTVPLQDLPKGLYAIQLQTPAGSRAFKFAKR